MPHFFTFHPINAGLRHIARVCGVCAAALLFCFAFSFQARALVFNFANLPGTEISFSGVGFTFTSTSGYQFDITSVSGGAGDSVGLNGYISTGAPLFVGGPFTIGPITTIGMEQTAPVSGQEPCTLRISSQLTSRVRFNGIISRHLDRLEFLI